MRLLHCVVVMIVCTYVVCVVYVVCVCVCMRACMHVHVCMCNQQEIVDGGSGLAR